MRAIMSFDDQTRSEILDTDSIDDHLKIQCRANGKQVQHQPLGKELFHQMKSVRSNSKRSSCLFDFRFHLMAIPVMLHLMNMGTGLIIR
jgi:hypothetical protein